MKILLVSDVPPCNNFTGGIVLKHLSNFLLDEGHNLSYFIIANPSLSFDIPENFVKKNNYHKVTLPNESWGNKKFGFIFSFVMNNYSSLFKIPTIARDCAKFIIDNKIDKIWFVVQGQTTIKLVRKVSKITKLPFCVEIWDPPEWYLGDCKFDRITSCLVMNEFGKVLKEANSCITTSEEMAKKYSKKYSANCIAMMPGLDSIKIVKKKIDNKKDFVIVIVGQTYAIDELKALMEALSLKSWQFGGKRVVLRFYGRSFRDLNFDTLVNLEIRGWLPQKRLIEEISNSDLLYCPYFFAKNKSYISKLSFPSKLTTYLKTGIPVLFHGPKYSSPYKFLNKYKASYFCNTMDIKLISNSIKKIVKDTTFNRRRILLNAKMAFDENLTFDVMKKKFFKALDLK
ncbi:MAG: hypothetical protein WDA13_00185 [Candidatus Shapirobacteria bacterium]